MSDNAGLVARIPVRFGDSLENHAILGYADVFENRHVTCILWPSSTTAIFVDEVRRGVLTGFTLHFTEKKPLTVVDQDHIDPSNPEDTNIQKLRTLVDRLEESLKSIVARVADENKEYGNPNLDPYLSKDSMGRYVVLNELIELVKARAVLAQVDAGK
jgi:hypothetical protein